MAIKYTLNFTIDTAGVAAINGVNQFITIVKSVGGSTGKSTVAWLTFPAAQTISVSWEESYWLYATNSQFQAGAQIIEGAITPDAAQPAALYTFNTSNLFVSPVPGQAEGTFDVINQVGDNTWQFGLAQMATIAGTSTPKPVPLNIVSVLNNETAKFTPEVTVSIFLQSFSNNGVVISDVSGSALTVTLTSATPSANIGFDDASNTFLKSSNSAKMSPRGELVTG